MIRRSGNAIAAMASFLASSVGAIAATGSARPTLQIAGQTRPVRRLARAWAISESRSVSRACSSDFGAGFGISGNASRLVRPNRKCPGENRRAYQ